MFKYKKIIVFFWFFLVVLMSLFALKIPGILTGNGFEKEGTFSNTEKILQDEFNQPKNSLIVLFENKSKKDKSEFESFIKESSLHMENLKDVKGVSLPEYKNDFSYVSVSLVDDIKDINLITKKISTKIENNKDFNVSFTGGPIIEDEMNRSSQNDLKNAELIGLPIAMIVLLLSFGGLVAAGIPLLIGVVSVVVTMGLVYFIGHYVELSIFVLNVVPMIGLALSIDFALLYINRFREELAHNTIEEAINITNKTAGRSIAFSGLCVVLGMSGMLFIDIDIFRSVAIGGITVVFVSVVSALTFLPALLSWLGHNINKAMILKQKEDPQSNWRKFASFVMKRPTVMSVLTVLLLSVAIIPIRSIMLEIPDVTSLPKNSDARITFEKFEKNFLPKNESNVIFVLKSKDNITNEKNLKKIEDTIKKLEKEKHVVSITSMFSLAGNMDAKTFYQTNSHPEYKKKLEPIVEKFATDNKTLLYVTIDKPSDSKVAKNWVRNMEKEKLPMDFTLGGQAKYNQEIFDEIFQQAPKGLMMILFTTYIILFIAFRSVIIPLKAIVMNMFSLGAAFGIVVWMFQGGHFGIEESNIALMIPVMAFAVVFGLSMDYEVFLISRIQEEYKKTKNNHLATLDGLTNTSKIISSAAAIMIVVTGAFAFTDIVPVKQIGIAVAFSIFIDATIVRMILVPSLMKLLGDWNWWVPFKKK